MRMGRKFGRSQLDMPLTRPPQSLGRDWVIYIPPLVAIILSLPVFRLPFMWDDFVFLEIARKFHASSLLPPPGSIFYRPLSREVYFGILTLLHRGGAMAAHLLNAAVLTATVLLLISVATKLGGRKAGVMSGLAFALLGIVPTFIAWTTTIQDLPSRRWEARS